MADQTLQIDVKTTADLSGLQAVGAEVSKINSDIASQLATAGAVFDPVSNSFKSISQESKNAAEATKGIGEQGLFAGAQLNKAKGEALVLARELATGSVNARTLGALLGSLGGPITVVAIAMIAIIEAIKRASDEQDKWVEGVLRTREEMDKLGQSILEAQDALRETVLLGALPLGEALQRARQDLERFKTEQGLVNLETKEGLEEYKKYEEQIKKAQSVVDGLVKSQQHQTDAVQKTTDQIALNQAQGDEELTIQLKVQSIYDAKLKSLRDAHVPEALARDLASETAESERQKLETMRGQGGAESNLNSLLREESALLQSIRQQQELIRQNPFLSADEKSALSLQNYVREVQQLEAEIVKLNALKAGPLDPAQLQQVNQRLQGAVFEVDLLRLKMVGLQQPLRASLAEWVNSFGSSAHQIAATIEGTINVALQGTNQLLLDAVFRTGNWKQTLQGVERQILNLFLTLLEQMALQKIAALLGITTTTSATVGSNVAIAASAAPAAAGTSIATSGVSAITGQAAALAAIAAIEGALFIGHEGGAIPSRLRRFHGGGLAPDEVPIIAQKEEFMIQRSIAQQPGMFEFLSALNAGMLFHRGGRIRRMHEGGEPNWFGAFEEQGNVPPWAEPSPIPGNLDWGDYAGSSEWGPTNATWNLSGFGLGQGFGAFGPTVDMTYWVNYPGVGMVPMGVPVSGWGNPSANPTDPVGLEHLGQHIAPYHSGGPIGRSFSSARFPSMGAPRFHSGGSFSGSSRLAGGSGRAPQIHVYPVMDRKAIVKDMASKQGQKLIFDVINGRRIDLGI